MRKQRITIRPWQMIAKSQSFSRKVISIKRVGRPARNPAQVLASPKGLYAFGAEDFKESLFSRMRWPPTMSLEFGEYDLPLRNQFAAATIQRYATVHALADAGLGLFGFIPVPGAAALSIVAALSVQVPMYQSMARDLSCIYMTPHDEISRGIVCGGIVVDSVLTVSDFLIDQVGAAFLQDVAPELLSEMGIGFAASFIPFFGGLISTGLDVAIAATMTWRVGTMLCIYFHNGNQWINGRRRDTYERAREMTGGLSPVIDARVDLGDITRENEEPRRYQARQLARYIKRLRAVRADLMDDEIRTELRKEGVPEEVIEEAIRFAAE
jgi:uncharacterized protein (DUF697 family)